jgi:hypothetical protein
MNFYLQLQALTFAEAEPEAAPSTVTTEPSIAPAVTSPEGTPVLTGIAGSVMLILTMLASLVSGWLRQKFKAEITQSQLDASKSLMEQKNFVIDQRLIPFALSTAEHWLMTQLPFILKDATDGDGFHWGEHWGRLRTYVKERVLAKFLAENVDLVTMMGEKELDDLVDRLLMKLIAKLPDSVKALLPAEVVDVLTDKLTKKATAFVIEKGTSLLTSTKA